MKRRSFLATFFAGGAGVLFGRQAVAEPTKNWDTLASNAGEHLSAQFDGVALNSVAHPVSPGDWYLSADCGRDARCTAVSLCRIDKGIIYIAALNVLTDEDVEDDQPHTQWWRELLEQDDSVLYELKSLSEGEALRLLERMQEANALDQRDLNERSLEVLSVDIQARRRITGDKISLIPERGRAIGRIK